MRRLEKKHARAIHWFHWINVPVLAGMIWSGLLIYWANPVYRIGVGKHTLIKMTIAEKTYEKANLAFRLAEVHGIVLLNGVAMAAPFIRLRRRKS